LRAEYAREPIHPDKPISTKHIVEWIPYCLEVEYVDVRDGVAPRQRGRSCSRMSMTPGSNLAHMGREHDVAERVDVHLLGASVVARAAGSL
jgi:hypothetical protein